MKHIDGRLSAGAVGFNKNSSILTAQNIQAELAVWLDENPSLLTAQNIQAELVVWLDENPSLLELAPTVEAERIYVSFNLKR